MNSRGPQSLLLQGYDKFLDARRLDLSTLQTRPIDRPDGYGWSSGHFVIRQGRLHAFLRFPDQRLKYLCGGQLWDVHEASVRRRVIWPLRILTYTDESGRVGKCCWVDWEAARRWFIPSDGAFDVDDFDWSKLIRSGLENPHGRDHGYLVSRQPD